MLLVVSALAYLVTPAAAVHDLTFQLDGDVIASTTTHIGTATQTLDWDSVFTAAGAKQSPLPTGFTAATFGKDFNTTAGGGFATNDSSTYTTGSKDTLPISTGWDCATSNNVNSKVDIMNAYAGAYTDPVSGHDILYYALERNTNTGDGNVAFWFVQSAVSCDPALNGGHFSGDHQDGDLLIVSAFTGGGSVSTVTVYKWIRPNLALPGSLSTTPVAQGVDCKTAAGADAACATVNGPTNGTGGTITTPWPTANAKDGVGHSLRTSEFFEGGLDLTQANLSGKCFNTFTGDTRSSQSLTATLFDYALGQLGECSSTTVTTPTPTGATNVIPANGQQSTSDSALITVSGNVNSFSGTVTFSLCGPTAPSSTATCDSGGAQIGSAQSVTTTPATKTSDTATITKVGRYCWRADFSGDSNVGVPSSTDHSSTECFTVTPKQPTISTTAGAGPVNFGSAVTDTASLTGTANKPGTGGVGDGSINPTTAGGAAGGTITFTLFKSDCSTLATGTGTNPHTVNVSGDNVAYGPVSFTPDAPGQYYWNATYSGDLPNTLASLASDSPCPDTNESVVVRQIPTAISTAQSAYPNDSATVSSTLVGDNVPAGGTVAFALYGPTAGKTALQNCTAATALGQLYTESTTTVGGNHSETLNTANTSISVNVSDTYYWLVTYATGDTAHTGRQSNCAENTVLTFNNDTGPGTLFP